MNHKGNTVKLPFNAKQCKVFSYLMCYVSDFKAIISVINLSFSNLVLKSTVPQKSLKWRVHSSCENVNCIKLTYYIPW
jgi:hypothetical protein